MVGGGFRILIVMVLVSLPAGLVAVTITEYVPAVVGRPVSRPVWGSSVMPGGRFWAENPVGLLWAEIQALKV